MDTTKKVLIGLVILIVGAVIGFFVAKGTVANQQGAVYGSVVTKTDIKQVGSTANPAPSGIRLLWNDKKGKCEIWATRAGVFQVIGNADRTESSCRMKTAPTSAPNTALTTGGTTANPAEVYQFVWSDNLGCLLIDYNVQGTTIVINSTTTTTVSQADCRNSPTAPKPTTGTSVKSQVNTRQ